MPVPHMIRIAVLGSLLMCCDLGCGPYVWAVEHPGVVDQDCAACHASKLTGNSVHSAMSSPCAVCHLTTTQGDMTLVSLSMPKAKICSACHEQATALRQHLPAVKGACLVCHDAHSSDRRMLLLREFSEEVPPRKRRQAQ